MLEIKNLQAEINNKKIIKGINLRIFPGEVHAIMGPNGSGKSSLAKIVAGYPGYRVIDGEISYQINLQNENLLHLPPDLRAKEGIFLAFQYPVEVPGLSNFTFLYSAFNSICKHQGAKTLNEEEFKVLLEEKKNLLNMEDKFINRALNEGFSGGEKKRNEILQMALLRPKMSFLDEIDSGLDVDSLKLVSQAVNKLKTKENAICLITHYHRILNYIKPDFVHILADGKIIKTGNSDLALEIEEKGYEWLL